jgi:hypothetical protein
MQGDWIISCVEYMQKNNLTRIEATPTAEKDWSKLVNDISSTQLWSQAKSWYMGANIPGKVVEAMNFSGGLKLYDRLCRESAEKGYEGFVLSAKKGTESV